MPKLSPTAIAAKITKGPVAPVYLVHGSEGILKDEVLAAIISGVLEPGLRDFNLDIHSASQLEPDELAAACATLPMMAERRVVVLRDVEAWKRKSKAKQAAVRYLEHPAPETVLVMVQGGDDAPDADLIKNAVTIDCAPLVGDALDNWLDGRLVPAGVTLTDDGRDHLLRATGGDLGLLAAEVSKLSGLGGGAPIDRDVVGSLVGIRHGETVEDWRDAVLSDELDRALTILPRVLEQSGVSGVKLAFTLGSSLLVLRWARANAEERKLRGPALASAIKKFCSDKWLPVGNYGRFSELVAQVVNRWSLTRLDSAVQAALNADLALKNTTISTEDGILTDLVLTLAASRARKVA